MNLERLRGRAAARARGAYRAYEHVRHGVCFIQGDQNVANQAGAGFRSDVNNELQALATNSQGNSAPGTTYRNQIWHDTTNSVVKRRNAANAAWLVIGTLDETFVVARSSNTILGLSDYGKTFNLSSTFTQTLTAAATLGDGWWCAIRNNGVGVITVDPNGAETIDGAATIALQAGDSCIVTCNGAAFVTIGRRVATTQTRQVLTSGTAATYTTPAGCTRIVVRMVGGGGGGAAAKTNNGGNATASTWSGGSLSAGGGTGGTTNGGAGGPGGTSANGDINLSGAIGSAGSNNGSANSQGGAGASSVLGGGAGQPQSNAAGQDAPANTGGGGSGGGDSGGNTSGAGGGAGGYCEKLILSPATTYTYTVGAKGAKGAAGTTAGGDGAVGIIIVDEYYD